jgi:flagellar biosynthetic protein FliR
MTIPIPEVLPWGLVLARAGGFMVWWPLTSGAWLPARFKVGFAIVMTIVAGSQLDPSWAASMTLGSAIISVLVGEFIIGAFMGFGVRLAFVLLEIGGHILAVEMGLAMAQSFNPMSMSAATAMETYAYFWGICLAVVTGWFHESLGYWVISFREYPPGQWWAILDGVSAIGTIMANLFAMGVQMAAPVMALILLTNLTFAFLGKVAPQVNVMMLSFSVRIILGLMAMGVVVILARTLFLDASSWLFPYTVNPGSFNGDN